MAGSDRLSEGLVLVLGLGNPGPRYAATRHNLGFMVVEELAVRLDARLTRHSHHSQWGKGRFQGRSLILAEPQTFMNLSGQAAAALMSYFDVPLQGLVAVHDDLDLLPGQLKVALRGSSAGHKGVASLIATLGDDQFVRLKIGIGRPRYQETVEDFVLSGFYADQRELFANMVREAAECLQVILTQGPLAAMQKYHRSTISQEVEG